MPFILQIILPLSQFSFYLSDNVSGKYLTLKIHCKYIRCFSFNGDILQVF